eukprot:jgi/Chlat1/2683/Chrsp18S02993
MAWRRGGGMLLTSLAKQLPAARNNVRPPQATPLLVRRLAEGAPASGSSRVVELKSDEEYDKAIKSIHDEGKPAVVDFTAKWCGPCQKIAPLYNKLSEDFPDVSFFKVDIDAEPLKNTVMRLDIAAVPTFKFHKAGKEVAQLQGADPQNLQGGVQELARKG